MLPAVTARVPLTCGELVQGTLEGVPVLVSAPIGRQGVVTMRRGVGLQLPRGAHKVRRVLVAAGARDVEVTTRHGVRAGAGHATSTADVAGALAAWGAWRGKPFTAEEIARRAVAVEPSDSTMLPGLALLAQRHATVMEPLGPAPGVFLLQLDPGGLLDTVAWTKSLPALSLDKSTAGALADLRYGLATGDLAAIGRAASRSALAYQSLLPSWVVERAIALMQETGALGVVRAHSGPIAALMFEDEEWATRAMEVVAIEFPECMLDLVTR